MTAKKKRKLNSLENIPEGRIKVENRRVNIDYQETNPVSPTSKYLNFQKEKLQEYTIKKISQN